MKKKSCFLIGHRDAPEEIYPLLREEIERHIQLEVKEFIVGHYGLFDRMAAKALAEAKVIHPETVLTLLLPYHPAECPVTLPKDFDESLYPNGMESVPRRLAIVRANRYMVDHVDYLIAYAVHPGSNTLKLVEYAEKKGIAVTRLKNTGI